MSNESDVHADMMAGEAMAAEITRLRAENERLEKAVVSAQVESEGRLVLNRQVCDELDKLRAAIERKDAALRGLLEALAMGPLELAAKYGPDVDPDAVLSDAASRANAALGNVREEKP